QSGHGAARLPRLVRPAPERERYPTLRPLVGARAQTHRAARRVGQRLRMGWRAQRAASGRPQALPSTMPRLPGGRRRIMSNCVFCRIIAKEIPAAIVYEDEQTLAFMDAGQVNPRHVLVAANGHAESLYEL